MRSLNGTSGLAADLDRLLAEAGERHGDRLVMLCSFQKEESVLLSGLTELPAAVRERIRVVTIDTGVLFPETLATWRKFEDHFGIQIDVEDAGGGWTGPDNCCGAAKVEALERSLQGADAWITGLHRDMSPDRASTELAEDDAKRGIRKYNPLAYWTDKDIWREIHAKGLPYNPLHDAGYSSIGCAPCTQPGEGRDGRWAGTDKTECGLHVA